MAFPLTYQQLQAQRNRLKGTPIIDSAGFRPIPTPVVGAGGGTGTAPNTQIPNVGGPTWAGSSNQDGQQMNALPFQSGGTSSHGHSGGLTEGDPIEGYVGEGIPTNEFSEATGRAPTSADYYKIRGSGLDWLKPPQLPSISGGGAAALNGVSSGGIPNPSAPMAPPPHYNPDTGKWEEDTAVPPPAGRPQMPQPFRYKPPLPNPLGPAAPASPFSPTISDFRNRLKLRPIA